MACDLIVDVVKEALCTEAKSINLDDVLFFSNVIKNIAVEALHMPPNSKRPTVKEIANNEEILRREYKRLCGAADEMREEFLKLKVVRETIEMFPQFAVLIVEKKDGWIAE